MRVGCRTLLYNLLFLITVFSPSTIEVELPVAIKMIFSKWIMIFIWPKGFEKLVKLVVFVEKYFNLIFHSLLKSESHFLRNFSLFSNFQFCKSIKITIRQLYCYQERQSRAWISVGGGSLEYHQCMFFRI